MIKNIIIATLCGLTLTITSNSFAQNSDKNINPFSFTAGLNNIFKKTAIVNNKSLNMATSYLRVMQLFTRHFEKATNESWYRIEKNFVVDFIIDGEKTTAVFNKKGKLLYSLSNCTEKDLSAETREFIKDNYFGYNIIRVIKKFYDEKNILIIQLEDDRSLINLWWIDGEMQEPEKYNWNDNVKLLRGNDSLSRK
jgi:hypothetical protein